MPQRGIGEIVALKWLGVLLVLVAGLTALALVLRDFRGPAPATPTPAGQLVIPLAEETGNPLAGQQVVANPAFDGVVICLDAAHGGVDRGYKRMGDAIAPAMDEALYTAAYTRELAGQLTAMGFTVVTTRDGDTVQNAQFQDVNRDGKTRENGSSDAEAAQNALMDEMQARIEFCNDENADLLISIHFDGSSQAEESGFTTWYATGRGDSAESQRLAELIIDELDADLAAGGFVTTNNGAKPDTVAATHGSQMVYDSLFMIVGSRAGMKDSSRMPGVVADLLTISNGTDAQILASETGRSTIVQAMAEAIGRYFTETAALG
ncbi:MAG: N-acetylmuramoyl-L-alanine amidase [Thermomicrobiales bacterium]|nr:N-acetylmuramoyl-L-alanine amidase [Thermomicrobiales bacterium]MCO5221935.1 N-acetylmuramoyl-L-alanine amidase [Thermomicrobiales bacterium]